ncbi:MAG: hypothetical protein PVJ21_19465 [Anaerolineales bacterium]|jgi:hypothetical protein
MFERSPGPNDIINLLSRLKANTPDYPSDLMAARKAAFLGHIATTNFGSPGQGGKGGGDGGSLSNGSSVFGGMTTAQGIMLQAVIGVWIIAAMLTAAYVFRDQIVDLLQDYGIVTVEITQLPSIDTHVPVVTGLPSPEVPPTEVTAPSATVVPGVTLEAGTTSDDSSDGQDPSINPDDSQDNPQDNPGLHLGQTPGTPDTPNQDNPNKPDKPDKKKNK